MKIEQQNIAATVTSQSVGSSSSSKQRESYASGGVDQVEFSGLSKAIQSSQANRSARVSQLTALVRSGKYDVSAIKISQSIVGEALAARSK